jgi:hypothetical protein
MSFQAIWQQRSISTHQQRRKMLFRFAGGTSHSLQERFLALRRDNTLPTIFRRTEKSYRKAQHSLFLFAKIGRQPPQAAPRKRRKIN